MANFKSNYLFRKIFLVILLIIFLFSPFNPSLASQFPQAAIASAHPLATETGHQILAAGGNAFDAAIAITASLAVLEPMSSGLGGGAFWLLHRQDGHEIMLDGREKAPLAASRDMYLDAKGNVIPDLSISGPLAAAIPGIPAGIVYIAKHYGKLPLQISLAAAIKQAQEGFKVDKRYQRMAKFRLKALQSSPAAAAIFLKNNEVPPIDHVIVQDDLADTLQQIALHGSAGFYQGEIAKKMVEGVRAAGGIWSARDLSSYQVKARTPIQGEYRGIRISTAAPPSSGGIALLTILNILAEYPLEDMDAGTQKHLVIEAMRRAYRDRAQYLGDSDYVRIPWKRLTSRDYAAGLRASIRLDRAMPSALLPGVEKINSGRDTTHFSVMDREGNRVSSTLTINYPFGSCFVAPGTGILLNDEMDDFSSKPGTPNAYGLVGAEANAIAPGKRPLSSMSPTFLEDNRGIVVLGTPGGSRIISMVLLAILDYAHGNGQPQSMVSLPRYHHQYLPDQVYFEAEALPKVIQTQLTTLGHKLQVSRGKYGNMQAVMWDKIHKKMLAASDPRGVGAGVVR
ncbi:MAG: gamma-glutamyltransferase [Thiohalomonadales bacterium]